VLPHKGVAGKGFPVQLAAGGDAAVPFTLQRERCRRVSMSPQGVILGKPTTSGTFKFLVRPRRELYRPRHSQREIVITMSRPLETGAGRAEDWEKPGWKLTYFEEFTIPHLDEGRWTSKYQGLCQGIS